MSDQINAAVNTATRESQINIGSTGTTAIATLATIGAVHVAKDAARIVNKIRVNRAAKKAAKKVVETTDAQQ